MSAKCNIKDSGNDLPRGGSPPRPAPLTEHAKNRAKLEARAKVEKTYTAKEVRAMLQEVWSEGYDIEDYLKSKGI